MKTLRAKFIFWLCLLFILMGLLIFLPLSLMLPEKITTLILRRDVEIAQYLSREVAEPLLTNNRLTLGLLLDERQEALKDVTYIFIRSRNGNIIASTFKNGFPKGLAGLNSFSPGENYSVKKFLMGGKKAYDIAVPLFKGELGSLHLGVSLESNKAEISEFTKINHYLAIVIFSGLGAGILIFTFLSIFLSSRIMKLKDFALQVGKGDLNKRLDIKAKDEIGSLAVSFNKMVSDLKGNIETIKKLTYLEERDRIAVEFHDGIAQNLADIVKRLELCERLFEIDPQKAFLELRALRENAKDILHKGRQMISGLKESGDNDFNLSVNLSNYIENYRIENNINVKLTICGSMGDIEADKSKTIFCIITEALTNIKKHSLAKNVDLRLEHNDSGELTVDIKDDGKGFDVNEKELSACGYGHWGLVNMRQRAASLGGSFFINSIASQGTEVSVSIPLKRVN